MPALQKMRLADDQDFANVVAGEEEFYGSEIAEKIFYVAVVENPPAACRRALAATRAVRSRASPGFHRGSRQDSSTTQYRTARRDRPGFHPGSACCPGPAFPSRP